jgi:nucleoside-diphosphate-sugar epimerase
MNVLVTGASGFVGKNLVPFLGTSGNNVLPVTRNGKQGIADFVHDGALDANGVGAMVHLAGKAHDLKKVSDDDAYYAVNTVLTQQLFDAFLQSQASVFIFISSVKAVADHADVPLREDVDCRPATVYGDSKRQAELYLLQQELPAGKRVYILRPCMIHGPGNKGNLNLLYRFVKQGIPYPLAAFRNQRSFLSVQNLCFVIQELLSRPGIASGVYHLADTEPISTNELIGLMADVLQKPARLWRIPRVLISGLARVGDVLHLPLNTERLQKLTENYIVDNSKIRAAIGQELPVTTRVGLRSTIASFQV